VAEARDRLASFPRVTLEQISFEQWPQPTESFDAVVSAQAFHWVDPQIGIPKVVQLMKPRGAIAFFWRRAVHASAALSDAVQRVHEAFDLVLPLRSDFFEVAAQIKSDIEKSGSFDETTVCKFSESITYDTQGYLRHLSVYPGYVAMPEGTRRRLFEEIARVLADAGNTVRLEILTLLYVARKKRGKPSWMRFVQAPVVGWRSGSSPRGIDHTQVASRARDRDHGPHASGRGQGRSA
jgi:hypothetical protein